MADDDREAERRPRSLAGADLAGEDLREAHLAGADLTGARLAGANLHGLDLRGTCFRDATLDGADLRDAQLHGADLRSASLAGVLANGSWLHRADLSLAHPGQLADMAAGLCDVPSRHGFCRIIGELLEAICRS